MFSKPGRAKIGTNASEIVNWAKIRHKAVMLSALQLLGVVSFERYISQSMSANGNRRKRIE